MIAPVGAATIRVAPELRLTTFARCPGCGRVYRRGAHAARLEAIVASAAQDVDEDARAP